jgi:hypothetical protein
MSSATLQKTPSRTVGPDYRAEGELPIATVSTVVSHSNVHVLPQTPQLIALLRYVSNLTSKIHKLRQVPPIQQDTGQKYRQG